MKNQTSFPSPDIWLEHRVGYAETDAMGVVHHAQYLVLFERGRSEFIRSRSMSYAEVERRGVLLPVREAGCRYRAFARYDEMVHVRTAVSEWRRASMTFVYEVYGPEKRQLLANGFTQHACVNGDGRPVAVPEWLRGLFA